MLRNSSARASALAVALPIWLLVGFFGAQTIIMGVIFVLRRFGVSFAGLNHSVFETVVASVVYVFALALIVGIPWLLAKRRASLADIGLARLPTWQDLGFAPLGFIIYLLVSGIVVYLVGLLFSGFNVSQVQEVGFGNITQRYEYLLAFVTLVVIAPIAEEALFRGYLYGKLRRSLPVWVAIIIVSALFGLIHGQWNVGIDVFVLSVVACILRELTGSIWAGILLHMIKNGLAFYIVFINTSFLVK